MLENGYSGPPDHSTRPVNGHIEHHKLNGNGEQGRVNGTSINASDTESEGHRDHLDPRIYDWALHPGGATILSNTEKALNLTPEHLRASYEIYIGHGNSSSATWGSVLKRWMEHDAEAAALASDDPSHEGADRRDIVGCAFGPGISVEMCLLRRLDRCYKVDPASEAFDANDKTNGNNHVAAELAPREHHQIETTNGNSTADDTAESPDRTDLICLAPAAANGISQDDDRHHHGSENKASATPADVKASAELIDLVAEDVD
jgi:hypothetical protein